MTKHLAQYNMARFKGDKNAPDKAEFHTLLVLWQDGPATMSEVARRADVSRTAMTTLTDRLEKRGLLRRIPDERDRRCTLLSTSARFEQELESIAAT